MYDPVQYEREKLEGLRGPTGASPLRRLTGKHLRVIALHLAGVKGQDIACQLGLSGAWVSTVLNDPLAQAEIRKRFVELDNETFAKAQTVVADALEDEDHALRLRAADMVWRARGRYEKRPDDRPTAEDIVARMLSLVAGGGEVSLTASVRQPASPDAVRGPGPLLEGQAE
jgi:hypothetical protein